MNLPISVVGLADLIVNDNLATETATIVDIDEQSVTKDYTYVGIEGAGNDSISLSAFFADTANIAAYDTGSPAAEQVTYKVTGVPVGFGITG
ncbi:hypothetical protein R0J93_22375, partial [Pseudoalteromonas sp. SIMBA_148]